MVLITYSIVKFSLYSYNYLAGKYYYKRDGYYYKMTTSFGPISIDLVGEHIASQSYQPLMSFKIEPFTINVKPISINIQPININIDLSALQSISFPYKVV